MDLNQRILREFRLKPFGKALGEYQLPTEIVNVRREILGELFARWEFTKGAEIGTYRGYFAEVLCKANPNLHLYCVDSYKIYPDYKELHPQTLMEEVVAEAKQRLSPYNVTFIRKTSMEALGDFEDDSLDFVYIDANHQLPYVINDLFFWWKKVKPNGILSGHDYMQLRTKWKRHNPEFKVFEAVNCFVNAYEINPWFVISRQSQERYRSYMIVKRK